MYKVIKMFADLQDNNHVYNVGDIFPREGLKVKKGRLAELAGNENKQGVPLIELVEDGGDDGANKDGEPEGANEGDAE